MKIETDVTVYVVLLTYADGSETEYIGTKPDLTAARMMATNYVGTYVPFQGIKWNAAGTRGTLPDADNTKALIFHKEVL